MRQRLEPRGPSPNRTRIIKWQPFRRNRTERGGLKRFQVLGRVSVMELLSVPPIDGAGQTADRGGNMRIRVRAGVAFAGLWLMLPPAWAQQNPAMENPSVVQPQSGPTLSPGANSFSEGQARDLLKSQGYSDVSQLMNDSQGIWRGTAMSGTKRVRVSVDYKGNISAQPE